MTYCLRQEFVVRYEYPVYFTRGAFDSGNHLLGRLLAQQGNVARCIAFIDGGVQQANPALVSSVVGYAASHKFELATPPIVLPGGEVVKNDPKHLDTIWRAVCDTAICRHSYVIAIGGGAMLDAVGYAAATAHRGVRLIRIPTTVLAQNDAGVGVKNSFNLYQRKNFIGTFAPPHAVINDADFLTTLGDRDWLGGVSEAVKVALIRDRDFFRLLEHSASALVARDLDVMESVIRRCAELHLAHIANSGDPFERGSGRPLDFGHWLAHKLEQLSGFRIRHGEAVAIGIAVDSICSHLLGRLPSDELERILSLLSVLRLELWASELDAPSRPALHAGLSEFREHLGGKLTLTLLERIGSSFEVHELGTEIVNASLDYLKGWKRDRNKRVPTSTAISAILG